MTPSLGSIPASAIAFKEWAVICQALRSGRQTLILRKGGIHEGRAGFRVEHDAFWLLPTHFHAQPEALVPEAHDLLTAAESAASKSFAIRDFVTVAAVYELTREEDALALAGLHVWSETTVRERFHYKRPGLFLLVVRAYTTPVVTLIENTPHIAGCRSWVELPQALSTAHLMPVLDVATFETRWRAIAAQLNSKS